MGLGYLKSQRHAASDRRVKRRLALHAAWSKFYQDQGLTLSEASAAAFKKAVADVEAPKPEAHQ